MSNLTAAENPNEKLKHPDRFVRRHIGPNPEEQLEMLRLLGHGSLDELVDATAPRSIRLGRALKTPKAMTEFAALKALREVARKNKVFKSYLGQGYYGTITPPVIQRNILENPGW